MSDAKNAQKTKRTYSDHARTVSGHFYSQQTTQSVYTTWGYSKRAFLTGFNAERFDHTTNSYLLGAGYRLYNPAHMRFNSPDALSPFEKGGINAYGYCSGDPVNYLDPSGSFRGKVLRILPRISKRQLKLTIQNTPTPLMDNLIKQHPEFQPEILYVATKKALKFMEHHRSQPVPQSGLLFADYRRLNLLKSRQARLATSVETRHSNTNTRTLKIEKNAQKSYDSKISEIRKSLDKRLVYLKRQK